MKIDADLGFTNFGLCQTSMTFEMPKSVYGGSVFDAGCDVVLTGSGGTCRFLLYTIDYSGDVMKVVCCDESAMLDTELTFEDKDFKPVKEVKNEEVYINKNTETSEESEEKAKERTIETAVVLAQISSDTKLTVEMPFAFEEVKRMKMDDVYQKTARSVVELLAQSCCGTYYCVPASGSVGFYPMPIPKGGAVFELYDVFNDGNRRDYSCVIMRGNSEVYASSSIIHKNKETLEVSTNYASKKLCEKVGMTVTSPQLGFEVPNVLTNAIMFPPFPVLFEGRPRMCMKISMRIGLSVIASMGYDVPAAAYEYKNRNSRSILQRIADGEINKNVKISKNSGVVYVYKNKNSEDEEKSDE